MKPEELERVEVPPPGGKVTIDEAIEEDPAVVRETIERLRAQGVEASPGKCLHFFGADGRCVHCRCGLP